MPLSAILLVIAAAGLVLAVGSFVVLRTSGARHDIARRLAGPPEVPVGRLLDGPLPNGPVRVTGRIRCRAPLDLGDGERLVAFHRDVEARIGERWRSIERLRETRSFELWDHDGSLPLDPAEAAEPLIAIPSVWHGDPAELEEPHTSAVARLAEREGAVVEARATVRSLNVTDRLLVLASAERDAAGRVRLVAPPGGYLITNLALPDAMRLLGGARRRAAAIAVIGASTGVVLAAIGGIGALLASLLGA